MLQSVSLTQPGGAVTAAATYGQYISSGYSYLKRADGSAFLSGLYTVSLKGADLDKNQVSYTGKVWIGGSRPLVLAGKSMKGVAVTGSTGAQVTFSLSGP